MEEEPPRDIKKLYEVVEGVRVGLEFNEENVRSAFHYKPVAGDIFVVTYPKCGTTWMQHIVNEILTVTSPPDDDVTRALRFPFLEFLGSEGAEKMMRPGCIKTHLPFAKIAFSDDAKYIYVTRNPYDCCVSYYYHTKGIAVSLFNDGSFDTFLDNFLRGEVPSGDFFEHLLPWYQERNRPNVLLVTYEALKRDIRLSVLRIADFLGEEHGKLLRQNPVLVEKILDATRVDGMRKSFTADYLKVLKILIDLPRDKAIKSLELYGGLREMLIGARVVGDFVRKGMVGDWKSHFNEEQIKRFKHWILIRTGHSDVMSLWQDVKLP